LDIARLGLPSDALDKGFQLRHARSKWEPSNWKNKRVQKVGGAGGEKEKEERRRRRGQQLSQGNK
jgi:hypothetical protein